MRQNQEYTSASYIPNVAQNMQPIEYIDDLQTAERHMQDVEKYLKLVRAKVARIRLDDEQRQKKLAKQAEIKRTLPPRIHELLRKGHHKPFEKAASEFDTIPRHAMHLFSQYCKELGVTDRQVFAASCKSRQMPCEQIAQKWNTVSGKSVSKRTIERDIAKYKLSGL